MPEQVDAVLQVWRHPRPQGAGGCCIGGGTDLPVDRRKAKRLARRIQAAARRRGWPRHVITSNLRRTADVGRWLRRWGWQHTRDPILSEIDFGRWEGQRWERIAREDIDAWCRTFATYTPGGGESLQAFFARVAAWSPPSQAEVAIVVGHGGWMLARQWLHAHGNHPPSHAAQWPPPPPYGARWSMA